MSDFFGNLWQSTKDATSSATSSVSDMFKKKDEPSSSSSSSSGMTSSTGGKRRTRTRTSRMRGTRKMRGGNAVVPYSSDVWSNESPFPAAVGGRRRRRRSIRGGNCSTNKVMPYSSDVWSNESPFPAAVGGGRTRRRTRKVSINTKTPSSFDVMKMAMAKQTSAIAGGRRRTRK